MPEASTHDPLVPLHDPEQVPTPHAWATRLRSVAHLVLALACAALGVWFLDAVLDTRTPLAIYTLAVVYVAWASGWRYALLAALLGVVLTYAIHVPAGQFTPVTLRLPVYALVCAVMSWAAIASNHRLRTTREQLQQSLADLRLTERRLQMALTAGNMMAWETDLRTGHTIASEHAQQLWGFRRGDPEDFIEQIHPDDRERTREAFQQGLRRDGEYAVDYRVMRPDGLHWYESRGRVLEGEDGHPRLVGVTADRTERHLVEETRRRSEQRFRQLADAMPQIVWVTDALGRVVYMNSRWETFTGEPAQHALDTGWTAAVHPDDLPIVQDDWQRAVRAGTVFETQVRLRMADGNYRWFAGRAHPGRGEDGQVQSWYGSNTDIDDLQRMAQRLIEAGKRKDEFLATLAHELRNPLAPIRNGLALLQLAGNDAERVARAREVMNRQLTHLTRLVDDLLDVSRISRGKIELRLADIDLRDVVRQSVEISRPLIDARQHALSLLLPEGPVLVHGDATRLAQAIANLLNNAARYTESGGRIDVRIELQSATVAVSVADNGIGIPAAMLDSVFELFTQVKREDQAGEGLGIGLNVVQQLAQLHGGSVRAESEGPQRGSRFVLTLPRVV